MTAYKEPIIIPAELVSNPDIKGEALIVWGLMLKHQNLNEEISNKRISESRGIIPRQVRNIKRSLYTSGACDAVKDASGRVLKYIPIDPQQAILRKMKRFITEFSKYFNPIVQSIFLELQSSNAEKCYVIMSGLEYQYRKTKKKEVANPWALLVTCFNGMFNPVKGYDNPDWWIAELERPKKQAAEKAEAKQKEEAEEKDQEAFNLFISTISENEYKIFHAEAMRKLKANGGVPKGFGAKKLIEFEMFEIYKDNRHAAECQL